MLDRVEADADVTLITRRHAKGAVVMSPDTYNSLLETVHLLRSAANAAHLPGLPKSSLKSLPPAPRSLPRPSFLECRKPVSGSPGGSVVAGLLGGVRRVVMKYRVLSNAREFIVICKPRLTLDRNQLSST